MRFQTLIPPIKYCKICFQEIEKSLSMLTFAEDIICEKCFEEMNFDFYSLSLDKVKGWSFYPYNEKIKSLIYQLKGCNDIELATVFLSRMKFVTRLLFKKYIIVPIPS